jgi:hypothetical protein
MMEPTKIDFRCRRVFDVEDISDLAELLFPGNRNQQHVAACILFELKWADAIVPSLSPLENRYGISRRSLQRARAKLARLGLIEHASSLNARYGGQSGWKLSGRFAGALRKLADKVEQWADAKSPEKREKEEFLLEICRPPGKALLGQP